MRQSRLVCALCALHLGLGTVLAIAQPVAEVQAPDRSAALKSLGEAWIDKCGLPGVTIAAIGADGTMAKAAAGFSRLATRTPMMPDDRMFSGSIGKTYFAAVALQLVREDRIRLDDKIATIAGQEPWFAGLPNANELTLRMLLNHTSGIREHVESPEFLAALKAEPMKHWDFGELLRGFVCGKEPLFAAGQGWSYADTNYIIAGLVIEKAVGTPMYTLVQERLLTPLKLADTIPSDKPDLPGLITGYEGPAHLFTEAEEFAVEGRCVLNPQFEWCGGGFISTSPDLARWARALWEKDEVLEPDMKAEMLKGIPEKRTGPKDAYGLGVIIWDSPVGRALGHTGMFPGYVSQMFHFEASNVTIAMQCNSMDVARMKGLRALVVDAAKVMGAREADAHR